MKLFHKKVFIQKRMLIQNLFGSAFFLKLRVITKKELLLRI